jgi:hypothetical protein
VAGGVSAGITSRRLACFIVCDVSDGGVSIVRGAGAHSFHPAIASAVTRASSARAAAIQRPTERRGPGSAGITSGASPSLKVLAHVRAAFGEANASSAWPIARTDGNRAAGSRLVARSMICWKPSGRSRRSSPAGVRLPFKMSPKIFVTQSLLENAGRPVTH